MNLFHSTKHWLKIIRWQARRAAAARRWGAGRLANSPAVLGNAMPKSGSHLIIQVLQGLTSIGPFVNPGFPPVNRDEENQKLSDDAVLANILRMRSGDIAYGYVHARPPFIEPLTIPGRAVVFVYRDPRDMVISHVFYAAHLHKGHAMYRYYNETLKTMEERIHAAIEGVSEEHRQSGESDSELSPVRAKYGNYLGWLNQPAVLCLRFEDLILDRDNALGSLLDYLSSRGGVIELPRQQAIDALKQAITPKKSGTFRKAQPGNWKEYFSEANKAFFKETTGDLLLRLGYEKDHEW